MKIERTKNATKNIIFGIILKAYQAFVPFLMRTAMIHFMGVQYLGLNSLFVSVLQVLNLAELGVGSAMVYCMYKPIAEDDTVTICALMKLYRTYYRIIGLVIAVVGILLTPFLPKLISGNVPAGINLYILYYMNLGATVLSYWLYAYKNSILQAHQRIDIVSKIALITSTFQYVVQLCILFFFHNYYAYVVVMLATQAVSNIATAVVADKLYPAFKPKGQVAAEEVRKINRRIRDLFTSKIGSVIYDSSDTIVISSFLGLTALAIFQNYFYIIKTLMGFISVIFSACIAGIGNSIVVETKEKNFNDLNTFTFIICWISGFCSVCLLCLYQPFMELWVGKKYMLDFPAVICFATYFFVRQLSNLLNVYKDASGMWHEDRFRPLAAALTNLVLNIILVQFVGVYGVVIATVLAILCVGVPWLLNNLFTVVFERKSLLSYLKKIILYSIVVFLNCSITCLICSYICFTPLLTFLCRALVCLVIPNTIFFVIYRKKSEYTHAVLLINNMTKGKIEKILKKLGMNS